MKWFIQKHFVEISIIAQVKVFCKKKMNIQQSGQSGEQLLLIRIGQFKLGDYCPDS